MAKINVSADALCRELRKLKTTKNIDYKGLLTGSPECFIEFYKTLFIEHNVHVSKYLVDKGFELSELSSFKFMEVVYKMMRELFDIKPLINQNQFFSQGFVQRKLEMSALLVGKVRQIQSEVDGKAGKKTVQTSSLLRTQSGKGRNKNGKMKVKVTEFGDTQNGRMKSKALDDNGSYSTTERSSDCVLSARHDEDINGDIPKEVLPYEPITKQHNSYWSTRETDPSNHRQESIPRHYDERAYRSTANTRPLQYTDIYNNSNNNNINTDSQAINGGISSHSSIEHVILERLETLVSRMTILESRVGKLEAMKDPMHSDRSNSSYVTKTNYSSTLPNNLGATNYTDFNMNSTGIAAKYAHNDSMKEVYPYDSYVPTNVGTYSDGSLRHIDSRSNASSYRKDTNNQVISDFERNQYGKKPYTDPKSFQYNYSYSPLNKSVYSYNHTNNNTDNAQNVQDLVDRYSKSGSAHYSTYNGNSSDNDTAREYAGHGISVKVPKPRSYNTPNSNSKPNPVIQSTNGGGLTKYSRPNSSTSLSSGTTKTTVAKPPLDLSTITNGASLNKQQGSAKTTSGKDNGNNDDFFVTQSDRIANMLSKTQKMLQLSDEEL